LLYGQGVTPDPGTKRTRDAIDVFDIAEKHQINAKDLFRLAAKVMKYVQEIVE
jgi:hypothetical protein